MRTHFLSSAEAKKTMEQIRKEYFPDSNKTLTADEFEAIVRKLPKPAGVESILLDAVTRRSTRLIGEIMDVLRYPVDTEDFLRMTDLAAEQKKVKERMIFGRLLNELFTRVEKVGQTASV